MEIVQINHLHNQGGFNASRLLVGVGHHTTDEVGLCLIESGHQVVELALEVGGDSLATLALLPVLVLGSLQGLARVVSKALDRKGVRSILDHLNLFEKKVNKIKIIFVSYHLQLCH